MRELLIEMPDANTGQLGSILLTHGASQPMTGRFFESLVPMLLARGITVIRFEFAYMRGIRETGQRRPPPRIESMFPELYEAVVTIRDEIGPEEKLLIGGKSMGGRIASMMADDFFEEGKIAGVVCLGYPFHPPKNPESLRTAHLAEIKCPTLIVQGERDPFGTRDDVAGYSLAPAIEVCWVGDGDHDLAPRAKSGFTRRGNLEGAADAIAKFAVRLPSLGR